MFSFVEPLLLLLLVLHFTHWVALLSTKTKREAGKYQTKQQRCLVDMLWNLVELTFYKFTE
jgi:hypothetical protein